MGSREEDSLTTAKTCRRHLPLAIAALGVTAGFLGSGCLWGVVRDAETGVGVPGATVSYTDSMGQTGSTTTGQGGLYAFDQASGPVPGAGAVNFQVSVLSYETLLETRLIEYGDNPDATAASLSTLWEIQNFDLVRLPPPTPAVPSVRLPSRVAPPSGGG